MLVRFKQDWFGPDGRLYHKITDIGVAEVVPDDLKDALPKSAKIVDEKSPDAVNPSFQPKVGTMAEYDDERRSHELEFEAVAQAEAMHAKKTKRTGI